MQTQWATHPARYDACCVSSGTPRGLPHWSCAWNGPVPYICEFIFELSTVRGAARRDGAVRKYVCSWWRVVDPRLALGIKEGAAQARHRAMLMSTSAFRRCSIRERVDAVMCEALECARRQTSRRPRRERRPVVLFGYGRWLID